MFNSSVIDVAVGLVFIFLLLSLIATAAKEIFESLIKRRSNDLEKGIKELLGEDSGAFIAKLYDHGLINSLYKGKYDPNNSGNLPSYIPSKNFALALMDLKKQSELPKIDPPSPDAIVLPRHVKQAFEAFQITAGNEAASLQQNVEEWFNSSMDRVSGWYKRRSQWWCFGIGLVLSIAVNVDCVTIAKRLSTDTTLREAVVKAAQQQSTSTPLPHNPNPNPNPDPDPDPSVDPTVAQSIQAIKTNLHALDGLSLPIGWADDRTDWNLKTNTIKKETPLSGVLAIYRDAIWNLAVKSYPHIPGWLLTALAVSLGAPFWFDMLNKIMVVRSTVKPHEKSAEEPSKDSSTSQPTQTTQTVPGS